MSRVTVWHDGGCPLCRREIAIMRRLDRRGCITFIDATEEQACPLDRAELLARFHAREDGGPMLSGAAAFAAMWRAIPLLRPIGLLARNSLVLRAMERLYLGFLRVRPSLQRRLGRFETGVHSRQNADRLPNSARDPASDAPPFTSACR